MVGLVVVLAVACGVLALAVIRNGKRDVGTDLVTDAETSASPTSNEPRTTERATAELAAAPTQPATPPPTSPPATVSSCPGLALDRYESEIAPDVERAFQLAVQVLDESIAMIPDDARPSDLLLRNGFVDQRKGLGDSPLGPNWAFICNKFGVNRALVCVTVLGPYFDQIVRPGIRDAPLRMQADTVITIPGDDQASRDLNHSFALSRQARLVTVAVAPYNAALQGISTCATAA